MNKTSNRKSEAGFFRRRKLDHKNLITNDFGHYSVLSDKEYDQYSRNSLPIDSPIHSELSEKGFFKNRVSSSLLQRYGSKNIHLKFGPSLHIIVVTLRCNHKCLYCHASAGSEENKDLDMPLDLAKDTVDLIFKTTSPTITIEFQGGEPLLNWETVKFIIEYSKEKERIDNKSLRLALVSNFSLMDEEKLNYLLKHGVSLCTSFDGPEAVHNKNRFYSGGNSYKNVVKWLKVANESYKKKSNISLPGALTTVTKYTLPYYKELIGEYLKSNLSFIYLRPLNPFGFAKKTWKQIGYDPKEFINFYKKSLDYIIQLNLKGKNFKESLAVTFLTKILTNRDPNHMDYRSPCGAGICQVAYNHNGDVYTCDEGRMFGRIGDDSFKMGNVRENTYKELIEGEVVISMCLASCLDAIPGCSDCAYKPYCGVCPVYNYSEQGSIFGQMPTNGRCKINMAIFDYLFKKMQNKDIEKIFNKWVGNN